ncbi:breast cancer type 2 susceptibility protein homolog [Macrosteles quadrilineatus]|uniref:breast cancer type 2 susceptibility protein homolog n=1 Tax=Macrosteles quadrilineatus TaxID=74068 RepID=UPI0023E197CD|nr:breast cancer type 2 susceptibility protein homolog [Macrosteles quadrilineatus]
MQQFNNSSSVIQNGFQTASGNSVKTSEELLQKAKQLFNDESFVMPKEFERFSNNSKGFQTANGKLLSISKESIEKVKQLFDDGPEFMHCQTASDDSSTVSEENFKKPMQQFDDGQNITQNGFKTERGNTIKTISKYSLKRAKEIFDNDKFDIPKRYPTASKKSVKMSEESLQIGKQLFDDESSLMPNCSKTENLKNKSIAFQTANGKSIKISKESLRKAKQLLDDGLDLMEEDYQIASENKPMQQTDFGSSVLKNRLQSATEKSMKLSKESLKRDKQLFNDDLSTQSNGFQTASGKSVKLSDEALQRAKKLFDDDLSTIPNCFQTVSGKSVKLSEEALLEAKKSFGDELCQNSFQTASGRSVKLTEEALQKAKQLFDDDLSTIPNGFQTASGKSVKLSEEALRKAKQLFEDESTAMPNGFQTASGKSVKLSEEALQKAKQLFDDEPTAMSNGFQTASGKSVKLSQEALRNSKQLFDDEPTAMSNGFQTASGKLVKLSEEALRKAKQLFDDEPTAMSNGFQTASGKSVKLSEEALRKAKQLFDDEPTAMPNGFQTASGKSVKLSEEALRKAKQLFDNDLSTIPNGFQTASGKSVKLSEEALRKAKQLFEDESTAMPNGFQTASGKSVKLSEEALQKAKKLIGDEPTAMSNGFQTASGKSVKLSEEALRNAKQLFDDEPTAMSNGFQTASGKLVKLSEEALQKAKQLFDDESSDMPIGFQTANDKSVKLSEEALQKAKQLFDDDLSTIPNGFQTASGKSVKLSEEALRKAKQLFDDDLSTIPNGFQTASGKSVKLSEEALRKAKQLFDDEPTAMPNGFQTASGKSVKLSEEALRKAKQLFDDEPTAMPNGFQTASGKSVKLSEEALRKAKQLFDDEPTAMPNGFQTASGKSVKLSEEALRKAKQLFDDEPTAMLNGFQTASGKSVKLSEEALQKAKQLFDDEPTAMPNGFQTGNGKSVQICKESLAKVKQLFEDKSSVIANCFPNSCGKSVETLEGSILTEKVLDDNHSMGIQTQSKNVSRNLVETSKESSAKDLDHNPNSIQQQIAQSSCRKLGTDSKKLNDKVKQILDSQQSGTGNKDECRTIDRKSVVIPNQSIEKVKQRFYDGPSSISSTAGNSSTNNDMSRSMNNSYHSTNLVEHKQKRKHPFVTDSPSTSGLVFNNSSLDRNKQYYSPSRKRRKLFLENDGTVQSNETNFCYNDDEIDSVVGASVISEADLSLLNHSKSSLSGNDFQLNHNTMSPSVAREVSESMAALLADEASNSPFSLKPFVSSPGILYDREVRLPSINCYENEMNISNKQLSPILDSRSSFNKVNNSKRQVVGNSTPITVINKTVSEVKNTSSFKPPYATSTPVDSKIQLKRKSLFSNVCPQSEKQFKVSVESKNENVYEVLKLRLEEAKKQEQSIQEKKNRGKIKPCKGSHLLRKQTEKAVNLRYLTANGCLRLLTPQQLKHYGIKKSVIELSLKNVGEFKFVAEDFYSKQTASTNVKGIPVGDGALLVLDEEGKAGVKEVTRSFLASPSIDPSLVSIEWVENHFKWIVLKMAAMERMFPQQLGNRYLTPNNVMLQMKYRYDREIDRSERPALRKILEKDESSTKTMVLFVADILDVEVEKEQEKLARKELELSDGWYSVRATIDYEMERLIRSGKVGIGTKLVICGAELSNNETGCHPLETPANVRLRVATNSTRRARWFTRLGFHSKTLRPMCLRDVLSRGGSLPALTAVVARTYPLLFLEKVNGKTVIRSERAEQSAVDQYQTKRQQCAEVILSQLQRDAHSSGSNKRPVSRATIKNATSTKHLYSLLKGVDDMSYLQDILSKEQLREIQQLKEEETRKVHQQLQDKLAEQLDKKILPRHVTRMLKVRLVDELKPTDHSALLTVWNPSDDVVSCLTEGNLLTFYNVAASGTSRFGDLQLTAGKQTKYNVERRSCCLRKVTPLLELQQPELKPQFSEVDVVGLVVQIDATSPDTTSSIVYVVDADDNFLGISFWTDLKTTGYINTLSHGCVVAASNLHWRRHLVSWQLPSAYATEMSTFSQHPRQPHLVEAITHLRSRIQSLDLKSYIKSCQERIESLIARRNSGGAQKESVPSEASSVLQASSCGALTGSTNQKRAVNILNSSDSEMLDTPTNRRLGILERYGEPPPISPLSTSTPTTVKRSFRPPLRKSTNR